MVPPRVAARWGDSVIPQDQLDKVGNDRIVVCSPDTLERVKRRLRSKGDGMLYIRLDLVGRENKGQDKREGEQASNGEPDAEREDEGLEGFLVPWEEMPEGCVALPGKVEEKWQGWSSVQYVPPSKTYIVAHGNPV